MTLLDKLEAEGIRRVGTPARGFHYVTVDGKRLKGAAAERVHALKLPPAWTDVRINPDERGHLQAIGKDKAGRWQYRYHPSYRDRQDQRKYERLMEFAEALPKMRATIHRHIRQPGMGREKVMACVLKILSTCFIRPGSQVYADENGSYGIATLRRRHVTVSGDTVHFSFKGKSGKQQERTLQDRDVARIVRALLKMPGHEVFKYVADDGTIVDVKRRTINQYIKEVMGERFSAKDFRTWAGTLIAACALARAGEATSIDARAQKKKVVQAVKEAAEILGNTPAICRASYIYPSVLSSFERGRTVEKYFDNVEELVNFRAHRLHNSEKALLVLLREEAKAKVQKSAGARRTTTDLRDGRSRARPRAVESKRPRPVRNQQSRSRGAGVRFPSPPPRRARSPARRPD